MTMQDRRKILALLGGAAVISSLPGRALAHRVPQTLTEVSWSEANASLEVIHELHVHDAELGLAQVLNEAGLMLVDLKARAKLALYVEKHFTLKDKAGKNIPLTTIGAEVQGDHVFVYQEAPLDTAPSVLTIGCSILRGVIPGQSNQINVRLDDTVQTLIFKGRDTFKTITTTS